MRGTVGVAPGTLTLRLGGLGEVLAPDPPGWYTTLDYLPEYRAPSTTSQQPTNVKYDPYQDIVALKGLGKLPGIGSPPGTIHVWQGNPTTLGRRAARARADAILASGMTPLGDMSSSTRWDVILGLTGGALLLAAVAGVMKHRRR